MRLVLSFCVGVSALLLSPADVRAQEGATPSARRLTEGEAVARLMATDPRIRALTARIDEVRADHAGRALWPNPTVTFAREHVLNVDDTFWLAHQELPVPGRRAHLRTAGRLAVEAAQAEARFETSRLQSDLRAAYTALLHAQARETVLQAGLDTLEQLVELLRIREESGEGSAYDRIRGVRSMLDLEADLAAAGIARVQAQGQLATHLGPPNGAETLVAADALALAAPVPSLDGLLREALANRGDYQATQLSIARFDAERQAATRLRVPTATLTGGLKHSDTGPTTGSGYQFSVDVAVPMFGRGREAAALATARQAQAEAEEQWWRVRIEAEVRAAHAALVIHHDRAERFRRSAADVAEPLARIGRAAYQEGEIGILELLDAERQALDARLRMLDLDAAVRGAAIELDRTIGREFRP